MNKLPNDGEELLQLINLKEDGMPEERGQVLLM